MGSYAITKDHLSAPPWLRPRLGSPTLAQRLLYFRFGNAS